MCAVCMCACVGFCWVPINTMIRYVSFTQMNAPTKFTFDTLPFVMRQNCGCLCHTTTSWYGTPRHTICHATFLAWNAPRCCFSSLHFNLIEWDGLSLVTFTFSLSYTFSLAYVHTYTQHSFTLSFILPPSPYYSIPHHLSRAYDFQFSFVRCPKLCLQFNL